MTEAKSIVRGGNMNKEAMEGCQKYAAQAAGTTSSPDPYEDRFQMAYLALWENHLRLEAKGEMVSWSHCGYWYRVARNAILYYGVARRRDNFQEFIPEYESGIETNIEMVETPPQKFFDKLPRCLKPVVEKVLEGMKIAEIAVALKLKESTVYQYVTDSTRYFKKFYQWEDMLPACKVA